MAIFYRGWAMPEIVCSELMNKNLWAYVAKAFQFAYYIAGALLLAVCLGIGLDRLFHTRALFLIILSLWGIYHSFMVMIHLGDKHD